MKRRRSATLGEHDAQLKAEGRYDAVQAVIREKRDMWLHRVDEINHAAAPVVSALREAGLDIRAIGDCFHSQPYPKNIPVLSILLEHLRHPYPNKVREIIAEALAVPQAIECWNQLIGLYCEEKEPLVRDCIARALAVAATGDVVDDVIMLAMNPRHGPSRIFLLSALEKSGKPKALQCLIELSSDAELLKEVQSILRRLGSKRSRLSSNTASSNQKVVISDDLKEFSANFDADELLEFLRHLQSKMQSGFGENEIRKIRKTLDAMDSDDERELIFTVQYNEVQSPLIIRIFMDDTDAPDVIFRSHETLVAGIQKELESLLQDRGA